MTKAAERLKRYLSEQSKSIVSEIYPLTPDASTREYFRICFDDSSAVGCVYPEPFIPENQNYLDLTRLFLDCGLPVPEVYEFSGESGIIVQEDLGDQTLRDIIEGNDPGRAAVLIDQAIILIARIQAATGRAFELGSISSKLRFDTEKLLSELDFFKIHYFESLKGKVLSQADEKGIHKEFREISMELAGRTVVLCHRDFHAANLMLDPANRLRIIDHQDARIGSVAYDLASLLLDRVLKLPDEEWLANKKRIFLDARTAFGLEKIESGQFDYEFDLTAVQRCLKAIGTFSNQTANFGKTGYAQYIDPMFQIVLEACQRLKRFPNLRKIITLELNS